MEHQSWRKKIPEISSESDIFVRKFGKKNPPTFEHYQNGRLSNFQRNKLKLKLFTGKGGGIRNKVEIFFFLGNFPELRTTV